MSAHDSNGYFVELGEYSLILAKANLTQRPRAVEDLREVWLGDNAGVEAALKEIKAEGEKGKAIALLRLKNRTLFSADATLGKKVTSAAAVEVYLKESLGADAYPANWAWVNQKDGRPPENGAPWLLDATATPSTDEALGKITGWSFELLRCQSASLALVGAISNAARTSHINGPILLCDVSETRSYLVGVSNQGVTSFVTIPVGFDNLAEATQSALGLKFRGSAARLMFNESYDFADAAAKIVEPLAVGIRGALPNLGAIAPNHFVCSGILARQTWLLQALASALSLKPLSLDTAAWATAQGLTLGSKISGEIAPSWFGVLGAVAAYDPRNPGAALPWNPILSNTPVAPAPIIPAILQEPAPAPAPAKPAAVVAAVVPKASEPAVIAPTPAPAVVPALKPEPAKPAPAPAKPAEVAAAPAPKAGVVITPPPKPVEPPKPVAPAPKTPPPPAKPVEPKAAAKTEPKAAPSAAKAPPAKPEPAKPAPSAVAKPTLAPAPAPVAPKIGTTTPFAKKKNQMPLIIGVIVALLLIGGVAWYIHNTNQKAEADRIAHQLAEERAAAEAAARRAAEEKARQEADARKHADEEAEQRRVLAEQARIEAAEKARQAEAEKLLNARGRLTLNTDPAGAMVAVGELLPSASPVDKSDLRLGRYNITITLPGYETESRDVDIKANEVSNLGTIQLHRQIGAVEVTSDPNGLDYELKPAGTLFVNSSDVRKGQTPATVGDLPAGSYQITVSRPGWPAYTTTVTVERNSTAKVRGSFVGGTVVINSTPTGASVVRDQAQIGTTPLTLTDLQPSDVTFTLTMKGLDPATVSGHVEAGKTLTLTGTLLDADRLMRPSELDERPIPLSMAEPDLTPALRSEGGSATVEFIVGKDGTPSELKVLTASNPAFGRACLTAAAKWKFRPGAIRGKAVKTRMTVPFRMLPES